MNVIAWNIEIFELLNMEVNATMRGVMAAGNDQGLIATNIRGKSGRWCFLETCRFL